MSDEYLPTGFGGFRKMTDAEREEYEERAAILEYDAGMSRVAAEALAKEMIDHQLRLD